MTTSSTVLQAPPNAPAARPSAPAAGAVPAPGDPRLPRHVAVILDGNGRWASAQGLPRLAGHVKGIEAVRELVSGALERGLQVLSLYAFSANNWKRPHEEVAGLMRLMRHYLESEAERLAGQGARLRLMGDREALPAEVQAAAARAESLAPRQERLVLNLAVNYGAQEELVRAVRTLAARVAAGTLAPEGIDAARLEAGLFTASLPPVDLVIRTAGERRLSNFLLWQSAYAELLFLDVLWPDFTRLHLDAALADFATRRRTFGGLVDPCALK